MEIEVRTDNNISGVDELIRNVEDEVILDLEEFRDKITSVKVHLGDESPGRKGIADIRCTIEVRPRGHEPVAVTHRAATKGEATRGAARQMHDLLAHLFGRLDHRHPGADTIRGRRA